jgi:hypothetical protein
MRNMRREGREKERKRGRQEEKDPSPSRLEHVFWQGAEGEDMSLGWTNQRDRACHDVA